MTTLTRRRARRKDVKDFTGKTFGQLTFIEHVLGSMWRVRCECGVEKVMHGFNIRQGRLRSCGGCSVNKFHPRFLAPGQSSFNCLFARYKRRARASNLKFELSKDDFLSLVGQVCHYCGKPPSQIEKAPCATVSFVYTGIDRKDNSKGYLGSNCLPCCETCNRAKLTMDYEDFVSWVGKVYKHLNP